MKRQKAKELPSCACGCGGRDQGGAGKQGEHDHGHRRTKLNAARLALGAAGFVTGLFLEHLFAANAYILLAVYLAGFLLLGGDVVWKALKNIARGKVFDENFLMSLATAGAFIIGEYAEAAGVMLFYQAGELLQNLAVSKAKKSITKLMDIRPDFANILKDGMLERVAPETVRPGDLIVVKPGERVPLDGIVTDGESALDTAALTGESIPRRVKAGSALLSGSVNQGGVLTVEVTKAFGESTAAKIIGLVENAAEKKAPAESFITKFARIYTPVVVALAVLLAVVPPLFIGIGTAAVWSDWVRRGLIFLVVSCPCALVISIPLAFFGGIGGASQRGVLVKGGNYLEALAKTDVVVFDKTGTLTKGVFTVTEILPAAGCTRGELLGAAAEAEAFSNHPIARSVLRVANLTANEQTAPAGYEEIAGYGVRYGGDGKLILAGSAELMRRENVAFTEAGNAVGTKVYVAADGAFKGCIVIADEVKPDAKALIAALTARGIRTAMLTGDDPEVALAVANELGIAEVYGGLLPHEKVEKAGRLNARKKKGGKLVFVGDGINDAPVLALSDVGVSMGGLGSDAAIEAADAVLMTDEPSKLLAAIDTAQRTKRIVWQNIIFALAVKCAFLILGAFSAATMWEAVIADVGVALLAVLNSARILWGGKIKRDKPTQKTHY